MYWLQRAIRILDKVGVFSRWTNTIGVALLLVMVSVTFVDVFLRYIFNAPIVGVKALTEVMMISVVFLAIAHTHSEKRHVSMEP